MNRRTHAQGGEASPEGEHKQFSRREGGQDITARQPTREEKAEVLSGVAGVSDHQMLSAETGEDIIVRMLRMNPDFSAAPEGERERMAMELMDVFETLGPEEARTALSLYTSVVEIGTYGAAWTGTMMDMVAEEHREAVAAILQAEREERSAVRLGQAKMAGTQLPLLVAAHAKEIVKAERYSAERKAYEASVWAVDDDIASRGRAALNAVFGIGNSFAEGADILASLSPKRAESEGLSGAIAELCRFWQQMRDEGLEDGCYADGLGAYSWFLDSSMTPSMKGLRVVSELSSMGCEVSDPARAVIEALRRLSRPPHGL